MVDKDFKNEIRIEKTKAPEEDNQSLDLECQEVLVDATQKQTKKNSPFKRIFETKKHLVQYVLLPYMSLNDIFRVAATCQTAYRVIDCNRFVTLKK